MGKEVTNSMIPGREIRILLLHALLLLGAMAMALPFLWMLGASFKPQSEIEEFSFLPKVNQSTNYGVVLRLMADPYSGKRLDLNFPKWYFNSLFVAS